MKRKNKFIILGTLSFVAIILLAIAGFFLSIDQLANCEKHKVENGYWWICFPRGPVLKISKNIHKNRCAEEGGEWRDGGRMAYSYSCSLIHDFKDTGNKCNNSSECSGYCEISLKDAKKYGFTAPHRTGFSPEIFKCKNGCQGYCSARKIDEYCSTWTKVEDNQIMYKDATGAMCD